MPTSQTIQEIVSQLGRKYGAERILLFGSYARGDMTDSSDIDLLIDKGAIRGLEFASLLCDLEDALGKKVDLISTHCSNQEFIDNARKDALVLYES